jgi:hypothetical protein
MRLDFLAECRSLIGHRIKHAVNISRPQFFPAGVSEHGHEGVIAIQQLALQGRDEHAFLRLFEQHAVFFFRHVPIGGVAHHMDGALLLASLLRKRRRRNQRLSAKA